MPPPGRGYDNRALTDDVLPFLLFLVKEVMGRRAENLALLVCHPLQEETWKPVTEEEGLQTAVMA